MSKEKPEVGDVWKNNEDGFIFCITYIENELYKRAHTVWQDGSMHRIYYGGFFTNRYTYLGKSKVKLEELFDVKKEENEKDNLATDLKQIVSDSAKQTREIIDNWSKGVV